MFDRGEYAEGQIFMCTLCVMQSRIGRLEEEKEQVRVLVDRLVE